MNFATFNLHLAGAAGVVWWLVFISVLINIKAGRGKIFYFTFARLRAFVTFALFAFFMPATAAVLLTLSMTFLKHLR